ncbi:amidohydrolase [Parapedomonas caeni]
MTVARAAAHPLLARLLLATALAPALTAPPVHAADTSTDSLAARVQAVEPQVIAWRRDLHAHPELANREVRTAKLVADQLKAMGIEVRTKVAYTGVVGVLKGTGTGPGADKVVALRADMDALPVAEKTGLPFASKATGEYQGRTVPVMHACGHDAHVAMLLGAARVLAAMRDQFAGTIVFIFQPAEEGPPEAEGGGAPLMIAEGVLDNPAPSAIFGIHVWPGPAGTLLVRPAGAMASSDTFEVHITGKQAHGAQPWAGIDPINVGAAIVQGINAIVARQLDMVKSPTVITIGAFQGGVRHNIVPETARLDGTLRTLDPGNREQARARLATTVTSIAESMGARAEVRFTDSNFVTWNDPALTARVTASLKRAVGPDKVMDAPLIMASEDFSAYQQKIPGVFYFLGVNKDGVSPADAAPNHSPYFFVNEAALASGVTAHVSTALDYLAGD